MKDLSIFVAPLSEGYAYYIVERDTYSLVANTSCIEDEKVKDNGRIYTGATLHLSKILSNYSLLTAIEAIVNDNS